ncbi:CG17549 [Drosophila busckii]|uniref:CG17549 n=1 Tax=Drosophila busckii TaxID=30019 RepID=A0A0M4E9T6_DROBS|nr:CG17549 [Drosophila busckii]
MWKFLVICVLMSALYNESDAVKASRARRQRRGYAGSYSGSYANGGGAGGYTGGYNDYDDYGVGYAPNFGITDPYLFHQQLTNQILAQNHATQQAITGLATAGNAYASADATITEDDDDRIQQQIAAQNAYHHNQVRQQSAHRGGAYNSHRYAPSYAAAAGSIGPNGHRQTAYINPVNPASYQLTRYVFVTWLILRFLFLQATPNIVNRFGGSTSSGGGGGGYKGVSVSSFSSSNGDGTSRRGAQTTINDNGKVTSYSVHS